MLDIFSKNINYIFYYKLYVQYNSRIIIFITVLSLKIKNGADKLF